LYGYYHDMCSLIIFVLLNSNFISLIYLCLINFISLIYLWLINFISLVELKKWKVHY